MANVCLASTQKWWGENPATFQVDEVHVYRDEPAATLRTESERICWLFMDRVYQAAGIMSCDYFDADGKLVSYRW